MRKVFLILSLVFCFTVSSCKSEEHTHSEEHNHAEESNTDNSHSSNSAEMKKTVLSATRDEISGVLEMNKETIPKMQPVEMQLSLMNRAGTKLPGAEIVIDLVMPGMQMPENKVSLKEEQDGIYTGTAMFTMKGDWRAVTKIKIQDQTQELNFDFEVK